MHTKPEQTGSPGEGKNYPTITALTDGGFVVSWRSAGQDGAGYGIYAQRYDTNDDPVGLNPTGTAGADTINLDPGQLLTFDGAGGNDILNGDDWLIGVLGIDTLTGGDGAATIRFDTAFSAGNVDLVTDFATGQDTIMLAQSLVKNAGNAGVLTDSEFAAIAGHAANNSHQMIYDTTSGGLYYNADGAGMGVAALIATFEGAPALSFTDIVLV